MNIDMLRYNHPFYKILLDLSFKGVARIILTYLGYGWYLFHENFMYNDHKFMNLSEYSLLGDILVNKCLIDENISNFSFNFMNDDDKIVCCYWNVDSTIKIYNDAFQIISIIKSFIIPSGIKININKADMQIYIITNEDMFDDWYIF